LLRFVHEQLRFVPFRYRVLGARATIPRSRGAVVDFDLLPDFDDGCVPAPPRNRRNEMRTLILAALLSGAVSAHAGDATHYINLVNTAADSIVAISIAPAGTNQFRGVPLAGNALHGGGDSATIAVAADGTGCLHDLRIEFANGRTLIQKNFDVCKYRSYHTGRYLRGQAQTVIASVP
jgi:hypothetical protein